MPAATAVAAKKPSPKQSAKSQRAHLRNGDAVRLCSAVSLKLAASDDGDKPERRMFEAVAYSGDEWKQGSPIGTRRGIIDLSGLNYELGPRGKPLMLNHGLGDLAGQETAIGVITSAKVEEGRGLILSGHMLSNDTAKQVIANADDGYPYEFSVGIDVEDVAELSDSQKVTVNGREFAGPGEHIKRARLREGSVVANGADSATSTLILTGRTNMSAEPDTAALAESNDQGADLAGFVADLSDDDKASLRKMLADEEPEKDDEEEMADESEEEKDEEMSSTASLSATIGELRKLKADDGFILSALEAQLTVPQAKVMLGTFTQATAAKQSGRAPLRLNGAAATKSVKLTGENPEADWEASKELQAFYGGSKAAFLNAARSCKAHGSIDHIPETLRATA